MSDIKLMETHISWIILTGDWTYKLKKPVNLGFVDFTTLKLRQAACRDEIRLNKRTASELYDDVVPLTIDQDGPRFGGTGDIAEYAVRMRQFPQADMVEQYLKRGELSFEIIDLLAPKIADLHLQADIASIETSFARCFRVVFVTSTRHDSG